MESIFTSEAVAKHPLKPLLIWKRMADSVNRIAKDSGSYMQLVQHHASTFNGWELDDINAWIKHMEILRQDLLRSGHTEAIADDCIVGNLLTALKSIPNGVPHADEWRFAA
eukprot:1442118-Rhodomonas_salina.1